MVLFTNIICLIHGCVPRCLRPGSTVKLYFSVPVALYTVLLHPGSTVHCISVPKILAKNLANNLVNNLANNPVMQTMYQKLSCMSLS